MAISNPCSIAAPVRREGDARQYARPVTSTASSGAPTPAGIEKLLNYDSDSDGLQDIDVEVNGVPVPVALSRKDGATSLVVFYNGAVDRRRAPDARVFQRSSWSADIPAHCLYICDPALYRNRDAGAIGWSQVDETNWGGNLYHPIISAVGEVLEISPSSRLHYGSSAGGYQALVAATADKGSRALVNNPQTDWMKYTVTSAVRASLQRAFPGAANEEPSKEQLIRTQIWQWFEHNQHVPEFTYLLNISSVNDLRDMMPPLRANVTRLQRTLPGLSWTAHHYSDPKSKHNPMPREDTIRWIKRSLKQMAEEA
jgi:hypothetical protein